MKHKDMGKAWKKIAAVALTAAMVFGTAGAVFATTEPYSDDSSIPDPIIESLDGAYPTDAEDQEFTVTIIKNETDTATDHEYEAYQIFTGDLLIETTDDKDTADTADDERVRTLSNINWGTGIDQSKLGTLAGSLNNILDLRGDNVLTADSTAREFAEAIAGAEAEHDDATAQAIAAAIGAVLSATTTGTGSNDDVSELPVGYYLIKDKENPEKENAAQTRYILQVLADMTVYEKASVPSVVKKIKDMNDSVDPDNYEEFDYDEDATTEDVEWVDSADYDIGDMVPFQITATTSSMVHDFVNYHVTIQDMFSEGLDAPEVFTVKVLNLTFTIDASESNWSITPAATQSTSSGKTVITVEKATVEDDDNFNDDGVKNGDQFAIKVSFATSQAAPEGSKIDSEADSTDIVVEYESKLNEEAVIGNNGNPNEVYLKYSNNPNSADDSEEDEGKTPNDEVVAFTYDIDVLKYDDKTPKNPLAGAMFKIYKVPADYDLEDLGIDINTAMTPALVKELDEALTELAAGCVDDDKNENAGVYTTTVAGDGQNLFTFTGIDAGTYVLLETTTPDGYNTCLPYIFDVVATHSAAAEPTDIINGNVLTAIDGVGDPADADTSAFATLGETNVITFNNPHTQPEGADDLSNLGQGGLETDVINKAGAILPSTGGIGTTLFYVIGAILVIGAGIVLVTRRRMAQ